jgi:hypothetical protein
VLAVVAVTGTSVALASSGGGSGSSLGYNCSVQVSAGTAALPVTSTSLANSVAHWFATCDPGNPGSPSPTTCGPRIPDNSTDVFYYCFGLAPQGVSFLVNPSTGSWKYESTA